MLWIVMLLFWIYCKLSIYILYNTYYKGKYVKECETFCTVTLIQVSENCINLELE